MRMICGRYVAVVEIKGNIVNQQASLSAWILFGSVYGSGYARLIGFDQV